MSGEVGSFYVIEFSTGALKVGKSLDPLTRIRAHARDAAKFGAYPTRQWISTPTPAYGRVEELMIARCAKMGVLSGGREYFSGLDFDDTVNAAKRIVRDLPVDSKQWFESAHGYGDDYLAQVPEFINRTVEEFNEFWRACKSQGRPAVWINGTQDWGPERAWNAHFDTWTVSDWPIEDETATLISIFAQFMVGTGLAEFATPSREATGVHGLRSEREARVLAAAFEEAIYGNTAGLMRLGNALDELRLTA